VCPEELEAADVDPAEQDDRESCIHLDHKRRDKRHTDIDLARRISFVRIGDKLDILHLSKPLEVQELFGHVLRGDTNTGDLIQPEPRRLRRWLCGDRSGVQTEERGRPCERHPTQEPPPA
jgi:hypothetical protein